jgi:nitrogen fixation/metabolism regulation signal transduction histidine kinase
LTSFGKKWVNLKTVIDHLPIAIFVVDRERRVLLNNRLAQKMCFSDQGVGASQRFGEALGCVNADENISGCGFSGFCHLCQAKEMIDRAFATQKSTGRIDTDIKVHSREVRSIRMTVDPVRMDLAQTAEVETCIVTVADITELRKKERLAAATETIGAVCHELNQPLQAIMGNAELLAQHRLEDSAHLKIRKICEEIERIKKINKQLLNLTDYQSKPYLSSSILDLERSGSNKAS